MYAEPRHRNIKYQSSFGFAILRREFENLNRNHVQETGRDLVFALRHTNE